MPRRIQQVNALIRRELSQIIFKEIESPPDILVTLTRVETASNLIEAKVWISVLPENKNAEVFKKLNGQIYSIQQKLNQRLKMRPIPKIKFMEEKTTVEAGKIEEILEKLKKEKE